MFKKYCLYAFLFWLSSHVSHAQTIAGLTVNIENKEELLSAPVSVNLDNITSKIDSSLSLQFSDNGQWKEIPMQITHGQTRAMHWILSSNQKKSNATLKYRLVDKHPGTFNLIKSTDNDGIHTIEFDNKKLLSYYYRTLYPPEGVDSSFKRSGFIHPLYSPRGQVLTRIQPPDHYHHYGIWNPWTHVLYKGDTIDFWNLNKRQGTVRFAKFVSKTDGPVYSQFKACMNMLYLTIICRRKLL